MQIEVDYMLIKNYTISKTVKRQLGLIIKIIRTKKLEENKSKNLIEVNPYTKESFCDNNEICHYHTLTNLETNYVRQDNLYHIFLGKLNLRFQVDENKHTKNMDCLSTILDKMINAIESLDHQLIDEVKEMINSLNFNDDCIALIHFELLTYAFYTLLENKKSDISREKIESYLPLYKDLYKALAYQSIGYGYLLKEQYEKAEEHCKKAIKEYQLHEVSIGVSHFPLIDIYVNHNHYYEAVKLCNELEEYYFNTNNKNRLLSIYIYLVDYYLLINSMDFAKKYYDEALLLSNDKAQYSDSIYRLHYIWGCHELTLYHEKEALQYFKLAYRYCKNEMYQLRNINRILICLTILNEELDKIKEMIQMGDEVYLYGNQIEKLIFNYFVLKIKNKEYRQFAINNIIPILKVKKNLKFVLLFFYEDVY